MTGRVRVVIRMVGVKLVTAVGVVLIVVTLIRGVVITGTVVVPDDRVNNRVDVSDITPIISVIERNKKY